MTEKTEVKKPEPKVQKVETPPKGLQVYIETKQRLLGQ